ncbi:M12 family metallo-peptidase [Altibacter sp. HG106]|uniref:M12 family metallo-peptidase n=1 Tax=Altibacter sp. HG106 TaxID=3023937 RepID=UPI002350F33E|nr:M12 family metallo-peptidase [Altibacter sp. HG106]MDC7993834.1 M12 family metallo-peptidase [Altibacter sp. HG106]
MNYKTRIITTVVLFASFCLTYAQQSVLNSLVEQERARGKDFISIPDLFIPTSGKSENDAFYAESDVTYLSATINLDAFSSRTVSVTIPSNTYGTLTLDLVEAPDTFYEFTVRTSSGNSYEVDRSTMRHYRGIVRGRPGSVVALSVFEDDVMGLISVPSIGNLNLGKVEGEANLYTLYNDGNLKGELQNFCETIHEEETKEYTREQLFESQRQRSLDNCVRMYFETEYDMYQQLGGVSQVQNYVTGIFNEVATLYLNESINTIISEIFVWTSPDPYTGSNTGTLLSQFQSNTSSLNGDLGQLLTFRSVGGGRAAGFDGICNTNVNASLAVSGIYSYYSTVPTYSWTIMVVTHEFGHLFGSRHTHACVWNGNNTAIDGCAGSTEGSCSLPGIPSNGGTIMSYCHLTSAGINLSLGFGPQPGNVIRNEVINGNCLTECNTCPTDLTITANVFAGQTDTQSASNNIFATNKVYNSATASYDAGSTLYLKPGFRAFSGSNFHGYIEGCEEGFVDGDGNQLSHELVNSIKDQKDLVNLFLYPNPTRGSFIIQSKVPISYWKIMNQFGNIQQRATMNGHDQTSAEVDLSQFPTGVYFVTVTLANGEIINKTLIKE